MNTAQLKKFAQGARLKLLEQVEAKLNFVLTHDTAELRGKAETIRKLKEELAKIGQKALVDKVSYTWFNRLIALRFMDANGYQPLGISVISPSGLTNSVSPQILEEIHSGNFHIELKINRNEILDILDGRAISNNPDNDVYKQLLVAACNHLSSTLPFLFERIDDYTELLLPDDLTSPFSIIRDVVDGMSIEDCSEVEIIGWLYQFYISEKKDEVFALKSAVKKEDIPAATQLFTPRWIVEYMVQNTVGKLWLQNKPSSKLRDYMPYFIESASLQSDDYLKVQSVEEIKLLDQASGSGHILVYGFDLFFKIYEEEGYNPVEIPELIVKNNLHGFEIDERAAQLACFAISMKGRSYNRRFLKNPIEPNILCYQDVSFTKDELIQVLTATYLDKSSELQHDLRLIEQATNLGSLILPHSSESFLTNGLLEIEKALQKADIFRQDQLFRLEKAIKQLLPLSRKYHCIVDNPPYMGGGNMNKTLGDFVKTYYPDSKADLMTCFMEAGWRMLLPKGILGMINFASWMFLSTFESFRQKLLSETTIESLNLNGRGVFGSDFGTVSFILRKGSNSNNKGLYRKLFDKQVQVRANGKIEALFLESRFGSYEFVQSDFSKIPGNQIAFWMNKKMIDLFSNKSINKITISGGRCKTCNDKRYVYCSWEVNRSDIDKKWRLYENGGNARKWYGNLIEIVSWKNEALEFYSSKGGLTRQEFWNKIGIVWNMITYNVSFRLKSERAEYSSGCPVLFLTKDNLDYHSLLGYMNSKVVSEFLKILNPTVNTSVGVVQNIPYISINSNEINNIVSELLKICKLEWDSRDISVDFSTNFLVNSYNNNLEESYDLYKQYWRNKFFQIQKNEEELNRIFIEIYGLQGELAPDVPLEDITILKDETSIENGELVFHAVEVFAQFVSYCVGCMFGRFSLDKEGLILANQGESLQDYLIKVGQNQDDLIFTPDEDNIIPILDDEWFEDDIVARFYAFLKASFGEKEFQKNLAFVEQCLGMDIRKYFVKNFYNDHIKRYKKRPIYWLFSSPKGSFSVLIYLHRYTPDTLNKILNSYLREFIEKLNLQRKQLEHIEVNGTPSEQSKARKEIDKIDFKLADCKQYEAEILYPLASERISLDLDDGVLVNYNKLGSAVVTVPGLNDKVTKKKVKEFDWIDTTQIR